MFLLTSNFYDIFMEKYSPFFHEPGSTFDFSGCPPGCATAEALCRLVQTAVARQPPGVAQRPCAKLSAWSGLLSPADQSGGFLIEFFSALQDDD